jgi:hypothetical protein
MEMTLCPRCGGHATRCECAELRREAYVKAAGHCHWLAAAYRQTADYGVAFALEDAAEAIEALARKPEPL